METILMSKIDFIYHLVSSKFASQYEAEQYNYPAGSGEWVYYSPVTKRRATTNAKGILLYYENNNNLSTTAQLFYVKPA